ncbi:MAG: hypothetical protein H6581_02065 [Bacteroidia bacterium]|nr:hypothetical protein [Bacteroidia bacterium]
MKYLPLASLMALFLLTSCSQYDEGPCLTFTSKENRIVGNHWVYEFLVDGVDSTSVVDSAYFNTDYPENGLEFFSQRIEEGMITCYPCGQGGWSPWDDYSKITILLPPPFSPYYNTIPYHENWTIIKLRRNDLKFRLMKNGKLYELNFTDRPPQK